MSHKVVRSGTEGGVKYKVESTEASVESIVEAANALYKQVADLHIDYRTASKAESDALEEVTTDAMRDLKEDNYDFASTFPVIYRWMICTGEYKPKVFAKYLTSISKNREIWKDHRKHIASQADYLAMLFRDARKRRRNEQEVKSYREAVTKQLLDEDDAFKDAQEEVPERAKELDAAVDRNRRERICEELKRRIEMQQGAASE